MNFSFLGGSAARNLPPPPHAAAGLETGITGSIPLYTFDGAVLAEYLEPGDRIIARGRGSALLRALHVVEHHGPMVRIAPTTLGRARPENFVLLPPDQRVVLRRAVGAPCDGIFAARALVDGDNVKWHEPKGQVRLVHLVFDMPQIVHAGGLELEVGV
ncbi:Hint domain-containing protein [Tropicimonas aquimaris]|uniref:Hint domain-containing protein n=1 Tax=Tropicimonas aquimaris TaxID=914152 RepID=A0ABW3INY8_9RHOB